MIGNGILKPAYISDEHKTWRRVDRNQWRKERKFEDLTKTADCVAISFALSLTSYIPPSEYISIGVSMPSEDVYRISLCRPKTVKAILWLRRRDLIVEK